MLLLNSFKGLFLLVLVLLLDVVVVRCQAQDENCFKKYRSGCPQSTFTATKVGQNWKCPSSSWSRATFISERWNETLLPVNTDNLTAEVVHSGNTTTLSLCSYDQDEGTEPIKWPAGGYCIPSPTKKNCPTDSMIRVSATVSAPGRLFKCPDMNTTPSPMSDCKNGTFKLNACCPKNMTPATEYLDTPMFDIDTFYLLKTNATCPQLYSFSTSEEFVLIDQASIEGPGEYFASTADNGTLKISFCRYESVSCPARARNKYESVVTTDCNRYFNSYCQPPYKNQPSNTNSYPINYCLPSGHFSETTFCGAQCVPPPSITNGTITPNTNTTLATVTVQCDEGSFQGSGPTSATCLRNGTWSQDLSTANCSYVKCGQRGLPRGMTQYTPDPDADDPYSYGNNVTVFCLPKRTKPDYCYYLEEGGDVVENVTITCQSDGTWSDRPKCRLGQDCPVPSNSTTATYTWKPSMLDKIRCEATVNYTCKPHRLSIKDSLNITCRSDGTWDNDPPNCETVFCDKPSLNISNGEVEVVQYNGSVADTYLEGDTLRYECDGRYRLIGDEVIRCGSEGTWNGTVNNTCILIVCPMAPLNITHGHRIDGLVNQTTYHLGDVVVYQCDSDLYELDYPDPVVCGNSATWNPRIPKCNLVTCDKPPVVPHSILEPGPFPVNHNYSYTCEDGYRVNGTNVLECRFEGGVKGWQGTPPTCDIVYCDAVPVLTHGTYSTTPPVPCTYGTTTSYTCEEGYNASVSYRTQCSGDETWRPAPGCHPVKCLKPGVAYTVLNDTRSIFPFNDVVSIRCDDSRVYHQPQVLICKDDGKWVVKSGGEEIISCHGTPPEPVHGDGTNKWAFLGVGLSLFILLLGLLMAFVIRKKRAARMAGDLFTEGRHFSVNNPGYNKAEENELTGFSNPTYDDPEPTAFRIDRAASKTGRLVLRTSEDADGSPQQYDTLRGVRGRGVGEASLRGGRGVEEASSLEVVQPEEGVYNVVHKVKTVVEEEEDVYNVPTASRNSTTAKNDYAPNPTQIREICVSPDDFNQDEDIYNVPTLGRNQQSPLSSDSIGVVEVNDLYSSQEAAQICGTPLETDFDNIIYDNI